MSRDSRNGDARARATTPHLASLGRFRECSRAVACCALALWFALSSGLTQAGPGPLPVESNAYGRSYSLLSTDWVKWMIATPAPSNPLLDESGAFAAVGQSGKVWFLAGTFDTAPVTRSIAVPAGTPLFFPIVNEFWVNIPEAGDNPWSPAQEAFVRNFLGGIVDGVQGLALAIDGQQITTFYRVSGPVGECTLPDDNIFAVPVDAGPHECLADGYWALLPPLSNGHHTLQFAGSIPSLNFSLAVTYDITVRGR
ncbi:MAG: hypothetical protein U1F54_20435 [Burkholderiales bacterium]